MPSISLIRRKLTGYVHPEGKEIPEGADLRSALARESRWTSTAFLRAKLDLADFTGSMSDLTSFQHCSASALQMGGSRLDDVLFVDCVLDQALFVGSRLRRVDFVRCSIVYGSFAGATVDNVRFKSCNLHGADVDFLQNDGCRFDDCNLWGAKVSLGCQFFNSTFDARTCDRFTAMVARVHPDPAKRAILEGVAGKELAVVKRLMDRRIPEEGSWPRPEENVEQSEPA